jgi:two-component system chemotaxis response regulator CheB
MNKIKVLVVDDSVLVRQLLTAILDSDPALEVIGSAVDPLDAREKIKLLNPDVITLDIEMPKMDGITFLEKLMRLRPMPVVMISTLTEKGADITMEALELGAVDYVAKPKSQLSEALNQQATEIILKVKHAARANTAAIEHNFLHEQIIEQVKPPQSQLNRKVRVIAIGASTGGTEATKEVLSSLPPEMPPIVITQHMPAGFTASYAKRLGLNSALTVKEFKDEQELLQKNHVYVANGNYHMTVIEKQGKLYALRDNNGKVNRHKPSVDVLFNSIATSVGQKAVGIILTGMGIDGANGLYEIKQKGGTTIAQDEKSCVVWGMPRVAVELDGASEVLPLNKIGSFITELCYSH